MRLDDLDEKLRRHHVAMTPDEFFDAILNTLDEQPAVSDGITAAELTFLREHGGATAAQALAAPDALLEARAARARTATQIATALIADSLDVLAAAELLDLTKSSVNRRIQNGVLWAFRVDGRNRLPRWQFLGNAALPGLPDVIPAIPPTAYPAAVALLMRTPQEELDDITPIEHLAAGGSPTPVADMLAELSQW